MGDCRRAACENRRADALGLCTKNPLDLSFDEDLRGKRVYFAVRWESGTVKKGPESEIFSAVIP